LKLDEPEFILIVGVSITLFDVETGKDEQLKSNCDRQK